MLMGIKHGFDTARAALGAFRDLKDLMAEGPSRDAAVEKLHQAESEIALAEADIARALGYPLCKVHWPPVIMLSQGCHPRHVEEVFECPACGGQQPPAEEFARRDRFLALDEENRQRRRSHW